MSLKKWIRSKDIQTTLFSSIFCLPLFWNSPCQIINITSFYLELVQLNFALIRHFDCTLTETVNVRSLDLTEPVILSRPVLRSIKLVTSTWPVDSKFFCLLAGKAVRLDIGGLGIDCATMTTSATTVWGQESNYQCWSLTIRRVRKSRFGRCRLFKLWALD